jgi:hypothetical protein
MIRDGGYIGSVGQLHRAVARLRPQPREAFFAAADVSGRRLTFPLLGRRIRLACPSIRGSEPIHGRCKSGPLSGDIGSFPGFASEVGESLRAGAGRSRVCRSALVATLGLLFPSRRLADTRY